MKRCGGVASLVCISFIAAGCGAADPTERPFTFDDADRLREPYHAMISPDGSWLSYGLGDTLWVAAVSGENQQFERHPISAGLSLVRSGDPFMAWSPDGRRLVFQADPDRTVGRDFGAAPMFVAHFDGPEYEVAVERLLDDSVSSRIGRVINAGNLGPVIATRWGGPVWSPDSRRLAFFGWPAGDEETPALQLYVADLETGDLTRCTSDSLLKTGLAWSPDGRWLALARVTEQGRGRGRIELIDAEAEAEADARPSRVIHEGDRAFGDLQWAPDGRRLFVRPNGGAPFILAVTQNDAVVATAELPSAAYAGWTPDGTGLVAAIADGMGSRLSLIDPTSGDARHLTGPDTLFRARSVGGAPGRTVTAYTAEAGDLPANAWVARVDIEKVALNEPRQMTPANAWLDSVAVARARVYRWTASDGTPLSGQLLVPAGYDGTRPLPLVVMPYGAYRNAFPSTEDFMTRGLQVLVGLGMAVVRPNTRGIASERQTDGYGAVQLADTHALLEALARDGIIDPQRVALFGHSHGGAMVYYYMSHSDRFVGGVAVNGAADWVFQARRQDMTGLPWGLGGTPDELPDKYHQYSPLENAHAVSAPLLAVAGAGDTQIPPRNAIAMVDRLRSLDKPAELILFEDEDHWIREPENVRRFWERVVEFMQNALHVTVRQPGERSDPLSEPADRS